MSLAELTPQEINRLQDTIIGLSFHGFEANQIIHPDSQLAHRIGEDNVRRRIPLVIQIIKQHGTLRAIEFVHAISNPFLDERTEVKNPRSTRVLPGITRSSGSDVFVQNDVPPLGNINRQLLTDFCVKFDDLLKNAHSELDYKALASFAYLNIMLLHPFLNGNGRTGRLFVECINSVLNFEQILENRKNLREMPSDSNGRPKEFEELHVKIAQWSENIKLFPKSTNPTLKVLGINPTIALANSSPDTYNRLISENFHKLWDGLELESIKNMRIMNEISSYYK